MKTTTATTFPPSYYRLPVGTEFFLRSGEVVEIATQNGTRELGCFYPAGDPLMRGYLIRRREMTEREKLEQREAAQHGTASKCLTDYQILNAMSNWLFISASWRVRTLALLNVGDLGFLLNLKTEQVCAASETLERAARYQPCDLSRILDTTNFNDGAEPLLRHVWG